jgi:hypothetical protein
VPTPSLTVSAAFVLLMSSLILESEMNCPHCGNKTLRVGERDGPGIVRRPACGGSAGPGEIVGPGTDRRSELSLPRREPGTACPRIPRHRNPILDPMLAL